GQNQSDQEVPFLVKASAQAINASPVPACAFIQELEEAQLGYNTSTAIEELQGRIQRKLLKKDLEPMQALKLIDTLQRLGIAYYFDEKIDSLLEKSAYGTKIGNNLSQTALLFRKISGSPTILQLAKLDFNRVQSLHQSELNEIIRWWKDLGLVDKLRFARDRPLECFLWSVGIFPEPQHSRSRIELTKTIAILLWVDMIEGFLVEAKWFHKGYVPNFEEYLENGVATAGTYMALVHTFFLVGMQVNEHTIKMMQPYPKLFSCAGRILRLWDDLGTAKEEQERGDVASSMECLMRENNISSDIEAREHVRQLIQSLWRELNGELVTSSGLPLSTVKACFNVSRTSRVIYQHGDDDMAFGVEYHVNSLFRPVTH
ncbi:Terpene synthase, metal-binding domain, partial [Dillenia turbinata]